MKSHNKNIQIILPGCEMCGFLGGYYFFIHIQKKALKMIL